jgi:hypothetical protein
LTHQQRSWHGSAVHRAACAISCIALVACASSAAAKTHAATFSPFQADGSLKAGLHAVSRSGDCWSAPEAPVQSLAYRCTVGNQIRDPCFEPPDGLDPDDPTVVCASDPWVVTVTRLHLSHRPRVDAASTAVGRLPWALQLATGDRCVVAQGGTITDRRSRRLNYACSNRSRRVTWWLFGYVDRRSATWRVRGGRPHPSTGRYTGDERWLHVRGVWR